MSLLAPKVEAFLAVAKAKSFSKAAKALCLTQSALSQRIRGLEDELNHSLFVRGGSGLSLTAVGENLLSYCLQQSGMEAEFFSSITAKPANRLAGTLRLGAYSSVARSLCLPILAKLAAEHPQLRVHLVSKPVDALASLLLRAEVDLVLCDHELPSSRIVCEALAHEEYVLTAPPGYQLAHPRVYLDTDVNDQLTVEFLQGNALPATGLDRLFLGDIYNLLAGVELGLGFAVLPRHLLTARNVQLVPGLRPLHKPIFVAYQRVPYKSPLLQALLAALQTDLAQQLN